MFWKKKDPPPAHVKPTLKDVWLAARLAQVHIAGTHSILSTILTELAQLRAVVEELRDAREPIDPDPEPPAAPEVTP